MYIEIIFLVAILYQFMTFEQASSISVELEESKRLAEEGLRGSKMQKEVDAKIKDIKKYHKTIKKWISEQDKIQKALADKLPKKSKDGTPVAAAKPNKDLEKIKTINDKIQESLDLLGQEKFVIEKFEANNTKDILKHDADKKDLGKLEHKIFVQASRYDSKKPDNHQKIQIASLLFVIWIVIRLFIWPF